MKMKTELKTLCENYASNFSMPKIENEYLYKKLLDESFINSSGEIKKKNSISIFGSPVIYSIKYSKQENCNDNNLRLIAEPGGNNISISEQIDFCLSLLNDVIYKYNWKISNDLNLLIPIIFPKDVNEVSTWRGGMWIGFDSGERPTMLKLYFNLRHQTLKDRWQRIANILSIYSEAEMEKTINFLIRNTSHCGTPVGIGCGFGENGLLGVRIYISFEKITDELIDNIYKEYYPDKTMKVKMFLKSFLTHFNFLPQTVIAFDFVINKNKIINAFPVRLKLEVSCCTIKNENSTRVSEWIITQLNSMDFSTAKFKEDIMLVNKYFNIFYQYCSIGIGENILHFSTYFEPLA